VTEPLLLFLYVLLVLEIYSLVLQNYAGLQTVGRWIFYLAVPLSILLSGASVLPKWQSATEKWPIVFYFALVDRGVMFGLVVFILLFLGLLSSYPITMSRNLVLHIAVTTVFLMSSSLVYLVRNVEGDTATRLVNLCNQIITVLCWSAWLLYLRPAGETKETTLHRQWTREEERRLLDQLTSINSSLLRATRK
jgi:hypothetical protein